MMMYTTTGCKVQNNMKYESNAQNSFTVLDLHLTSNFKMNTLFVKGIITHIDPRGRPTVTAGGDHVHMLSVRPSVPTSSKQNKFQAKVMFTTGEIFNKTLGLINFLINFSTDNCFKLRSI